MIENVIIAFISYNILTSTNFKHFSNPRPIVTAPAQSRIVDVGRPGPGRFTKPAGYTDTDSAQLGPPLRWPLTQYM